MVLKKNNPEYIVVTDTLDLHGTPEKIIPEMLEDFINNAIDNGYRQILIIHGKGKSKLKYITLKILKNNPNIKTFYDARPEQGGWGRTIAELNLYT